MQPRKYTNIFLQILNLLRMYTSDNAGGEFMPTSTVVQFNTTSTSKEEEGDVLTIEVT